MGIPWNSPFPVIEQRFPGVEFVDEDAFHVTRFRLLHPEEYVDRVEFKLFENQLASVTRYYGDKSIDHLINEDYIGKMVSGLGSRKAVRKTTSKSLAGVAEVEIHEYTNVLVLFRYYPPGQKEGFVDKENSIVIIYKPTFDKMVYYRKHSEGDPEEIVDYDYIEF
ncbi:hypothetical protein GF1_06560 [Desulfolithobacter dissulfuricans]|uniref:Uncharacterized protein n=1 Tax=Desulfolithobacter dissulfuricans TaxID=2795293 RepID=A0A915TZT3_9BACT|nr:hypothetical protein [Desulfolithobacter dissulfuricans]BCO08280.1 hypothetical protein GF1_06560 [Desulfolithobacter dissulfuricans]